MPAVVKAAAAMTACKDERCVQDEGKLLEQLVTLIAARRSVELT